MKNSNNYIKFGILFYALFLISNCFNILPEFIKGFLVGLGSSLFIVGIFSKNNKFRNYKIGLLKKIR